LAGRVYTLSDVRDALSNDAIPVALALKTFEQERATYHCTRTEISLNKLGWKVGHLHDVGLGRGDLPTMPVEKLFEHFSRFLSPSNMFVVPLSWAGLAELPEMLASLRASGTVAA